MVVLLLEVMVVVVVAVQVEGVEMEVLKVME